MHSTDQEQDYDYVGLWPRFYAFIIDNIITGILLALITFYNISFVKSFYLYLVVTLVVLAYKPVMEKIYGATLGKMLLHIKVIDLVGEPLSWFQALLRVIFQISQVLLVLPFQFAAFSDPILLETSGFFEYNDRFVQDYSGVSIISNVMFFILAVEIVFMNTDPKHRTIHDRIAKTYVVKDE
jgi:uncharacterized RDD family membrane protein YckC